MMPTSRYRVTGVALGLSLVLASSVVQSEETDPVPTSSHLIEHKTDSCMEEGGWSGAAMRECAVLAYDDWQAEIERLETRLARRLGSDAREALEHAQRQWEQGRDADLAFVAAYYSDLRRAGPPPDDAEAEDDAQGSLWPLAEQLRRNAVLEDRARQLQRYLDGLEELGRPEVGVQP